MFKLGSFEAEIAKSMADNLASNIEAKKQEIVKTAQLVKQNKVEQAINHLNTAAKLFDNAGFTSTAEMLTRVLEKLADKKEDEPKFIEFESLLEEPKDEPELGEQVIEMSSLLGDDSGKKKH
jgi:arginine deiminase